ncbi:nucleoside hydrolase [Oleidesulfovibrio sp.]|uniref:nucleoside hydrolase n=1 Tax=Oleidesulfovibrio sp. TaxID=2909707 RepID=UPI003A8901D9
MLDTRTILGGSVRNGPVKVLLDIDNAMGMPVRDVDDGVALALALWSPRIELVACTACAGNCRAAASAQNTLRMLDLAGRSDIPVAIGPDIPVDSVDRTRHHAFLDAKSAGDGARYWDHVSLCPPSSKAAAEPACDLIASMVRQYPHELVLVMEGSFTNLALAIRKYPDIVPLIGAVVHMGGVFTATQPDEMQPVWNTPDIPEAVWKHALRFNTWYDPQATAQVVTSGVPLYFVPVNVTSRTSLTQEQAEAMYVGDDPLRAFVRNTLIPWVLWSTEVRGLSGAHMHDALALAVVSDVDMCVWKNMYIDIGSFLEGRDWLLSGYKKPYHEVRVAVSLDIPRFDDWLHKLLQIRK